MKLRTKNQARYIESHQQSTENTDSNRSVTNNSTLNSSTITVTALNDSTLDRVVCTLSFIDCKVSSIADQNRNCCYYVFPSLRYLRVS